MAEIPPGTRQQCSLCQVEIQGMVGGNDLVHFSQGGPGTRAKLWARVCQYAQERGGCINSNPALRSEPNPTDFYGEAPPIELNP